MLLILVLTLVALVLTLVVMLVAQRISTCTAWGRLRSSLVGLCVDLLQL